MRTKSRTRRGTGRGRGPLVVSLRQSSHPRIVLAHALAYAAAPGCLVDYQALRSAVLRHGISQAEFELELGRFADEGALFIARYRSPQGLLLNQYTLATELRVK